MGVEDQWIAGGGRQWGMRSGRQHACLSGVLTRETEEIERQRRPEDRRSVGGGCRGRARAGVCVYGGAGDGAEEEGTQIRFWGLGLWAVYCFMDLSLH